MAQPLLDPVKADLIARGVAQLLGLPFNEHWRGVEVYAGPDRVVVVVPQVVNWRIVEAGPGEAMTWKRAWCYPDGPVAAVVAAAAWVGAAEPDDAPWGWLKAVHTGEYRHDWKE